ncbi:MAG TPA: S9 family peptidase [Thermoanaerobaculia bacterium]|jgi:dipeptidyl aminopeptidase/acylaminoacyl peptidase|nr:S9 family peptidase [Thermoanaerobaculia bacterium]
MRRLSLILTLALTATAAAQRPMTFEDLAAMKRVGVPALSPDGKWIAYDVTSVDLAKNTKPTAVWLMRADGSGAKEIAAGDSPAWSPDGKRIAFTSGGQISLYDVATAKTRKLPEIAGGASSLKWVPGGKALLAVSDVEIGPKSETKARVIDSLLYRHWTTWQEPTRAHILYVPLSGGATRDLTPGAFDAPPFAVGGGSEFDVSPDGKELVYARNTDPRPERSTNADLFLVPLTGGEATRMTTRGGADTAPVYSPDGRWIAYRSQARAGFEADLWELWLYDRATKQSKRIAANFPNWIESVSWTPDGKSMFVTAPLEGRNAIYEVALDGVPRLVHNAGSADAIEIAPDAKTIYFQMSTLSRPADIYAMTRDGRTTRLTHHNDTRLGQVQMASYESINWKGGGDARVQGWLLKPPGFDPSKKYPAILLIHGGPQGAWGESWSYRWNPQMFAARGYVILMPNPRGSSGFGQQFVDEISRDWAGRVYTDIMNGVDLLASQPYVDANRLGAAGASYGGYMVNWILGHTNRFKALVSHAGVYNLESMYGVTEEQWFPEWEFGGPPWENEEIYARLSPHRFAKNFNTPTLVSHGELDFRVPIGEGLQLFTALQRKGVPSRLLYFPDEGHWVLKPQNSKVWHQTVLDWLDQWLK